MNGLAMTGVMGTLVLVAMTGVTLTSREEKVIAPRDIHGAENGSLADLERQLNADDAAFMASYERYHPRNVQQNLSYSNDGVIASKQTRSEFSVNVDGHLYRVPESPAHNNGDSRSQQVQLDVFSGGLTVSQKRDYIREVCVCVLCINASRLHPEVIFVSCKWTI